MDYYKLGKLALTRASEAVDEAFATSNQWTKDTQLALAKRMEKLADEATASLELQARIHKLT